MRLQPFDSNSTFSQYSTRLQVVAAAVCFSLAAASAAAAERSITYKSPTGESQDYGFTVERKTGEITVIPEEGPPYIQELWGTPDEAKMHATTWNSPFGPQYFRHVGTFDVVPENKYRVRVFPATFYQDGTFVLHDDPNPESTYVKQEVFYVE